VARDPIETMNNNAWQEARVRAGLPQVRVHDLKHTFGRRLRAAGVSFEDRQDLLVAFILYTMTLAKVREIAVLKLIGARNRTIAGMILQQALALGAIGFVVGKTAATLWAPVFPKYVLLLPGDAVAGAVLVLAICALASIVAIRAALRVDPATAIGG
jgi:putative ABC transport system permease protein